MLLGVAKRVLAFVVALFAVVACGKADDLKLWQGVFTLPATSGALEMTTKGEGANQVVQLRFALDGHPADSVISQLQLSATAISSLATLAIKLYQFAGSRCGNQWEGTLVATGSPGDRGTWRLTHNDLSNAVSNPNDPLPAVTGRFSTGRTAYHWVDDQRPELETRAPDDRRELLVYVFYLAEANALAARAPYMPDAEVMRGAWEDDLTDRLKRLRAHSQ
jgi:hypothetical protein